MLIRTIIVSISIFSSYTLQQEIEKKDEFSSKLIEDFEPFNTPLEELEKESKKGIKLSEQCLQYEDHYKYYCNRTNIAKYNEEVRIICERYDYLCRDRVFASYDYIRRQKVMWRQAGVPRATERKLVKCYASCSERDPLCVQACECIYLNWVMLKACEPGVSDTALLNCQRWSEKCKTVWRPLPDQTPYPLSVNAPPPIVRGVFYGYDGLGTHSTFDKLREHGVSFYRGTNVVNVNWPEGKFGSQTAFEVPFAGVRIVPQQINIGMPNLAAFYRDTLKIRGLNPGTGRRHYF